MSFWVKVENMNQLVIEADLHSEAHSEAILSLMKEYALDVMGGGQPLPEDVALRLLPALRKRADVYVFLAYRHAEPVGMAVCFEGFSTFAARPLINIHDLIVKKEFRGFGIGRAILKKVEEKAHYSGCCKITLEVIEGNKSAKELYSSFGFVNYELDKSMGRAVFMEKKLYQNL